MNPTSIALHTLFDNIPRRHTIENVKEINNILTEYEDLLISIEAENAWYEKNINTFFDGIENVRALVKKSSDNKASKKTKDALFDEASGNLKDNMQLLVELYADGSKRP